jgi:lysophospholipase L1-like esterase
VPGRFPDPDPNAASVPDEAASGGDSGAPTVAPVAAAGSVERRAIRRVLGVVTGLAVSIGATYAIPGLAPLRPWVPGGDYVPFWNLIGREWMGQEAELRAEAAALEALRRRTEAVEAPRSPERAVPPPPPVPVFPAYQPETRVERPEHGIEPPEALDSYMRKLTLVDLGVPGAIARAGHWGDSVLGVDGITSGIRRRLQARFGDAGHGFHLMDRYNPSYRQQGVDFVPSGGWERCLVVFECRKQDRRYGYGGLIAQSGGGGVSTWRTPKEGFGQTVSRFEVWFAHQEKGGNLEILVDGEEKITVSTRGPHLEDGWHEVRVPPGRHSFQVRAAGGGNVRAYGVVLENDGPGVVWDGMALIGGSTRGLRTQDPEHIADQIRRRGADLIVFMFGGNDMQRNYVDLRQSMQPYYDEYGDVLRHFRGGTDRPACLVMSLTDHGERREDDSIVSRPFGKQLSLAQREVARQNGCGFFDTYEAMGGVGSAARWYRSKPRLLSPDLGHPNPFGHEVIAGLLANALLYAYEGYRDRMEGQPLPELAEGNEAAAPAAGGGPERPGERGNASDDGPQGPGESGTVSDEAVSSD